MNERSFIVKYASENLSYLSPTPAKTPTPETLSNTHSVPRGRPRWQVSFTATKCRNPGLKHVVAAYFTTSYPILLP
jgi:hypothetical protein